jgi:hypothetical protein
MAMVQVAVLAARSLRSQLAIAPVDERLDPNESSLMT